MIGPEEKKELGVIIVENQGGRGRGLKAAREFKKGETCVHYSNTFVSWEEKKTLTLDDFKYRYDIDDISGSYYRDPDGVAVGHLVNDFMDPKLLEELRGCKTIKKCARWAYKYMSQVTWSSPMLRELALTGKIASKFIIESGGANVEFFEPNGCRKGLYLRALCDIKAGDDLLTAYGADYWIGELQVDPSVAPSTRMGLVAWAMKQMVFPTLGMMHKMPSLVFPCRNSRGEPSIVQLGSMYIDQKVVGESAATETARDILCTRWLRLVGLEGEGLRDWIAACLKVGTREIVIDDAGNSM
jgi:hypothetical protein